MGLSHMKGYEYKILVESLLALDGIKAKVTIKCPCGEGNAENKKFYGPHNQIAGVVIYLRQNSYYMPCCNHIHYYLNDRFLVVYDFRNKQETSLGDESLPLL